MVEVRKARKEGEASSRRRRYTFFAYLAAAGPGLIAANAGNDAGGVATYASAGSQFAYKTLFFMVLVTVGLVVVQEMAARIGVFSGKGLASLIREQFSLRFTFLAVVALTVTNIGLVVSEFAGIGASLDLFGISRYISVPIAAVVIWSLVLMGSYKYAERIFLVMSVAFLAYPIAAFMGHPHYGQILSNLALPHFVASRDYIYLAVALIGTTISPYMQLYAASGVVDRGISPEEYPLERIDAVGGAIFANIISIAIIVATAAAIGGTGPLASASQAALALQPVAGRFATDLFAVGLFGASALAAAVVPLSTSYAIAEAAGYQRSVSSSFREAPVFLGIFTAQVVIGAAISLIPVNLIKLLVLSQVLQGLITPIILVFILVLANRRSVLGEHSNGPIFRTVATVVVTGVSALSLLLLGQTVLGWFHIGG
ncbi:MAG: divalent metal cation transporter [Actinomycetota bacterium]|nr:divalent metal cation transporter [Actinomycetota bacterium]